jgi:hypothetical protein
MDQPRDPPAPFKWADMVMRAGGLRRHGPTSVVEPARRSYGYAFTGSPWIWDRGVRNAVHRTPSPVFS